MKNDATQLEVLLVTGTSFLYRQCYEADNLAIDFNPLSEKEKLEEAWWNGLVQELLPEIFGSHKEARLFIWEIRDESSFLNLEIGESPGEIQQSFSLNPYFFLRQQAWN